MRVKIRGVVWPKSPPIHQPISSKTKIPTKPNPNYKIAIIILNITKMALFPTLLTISKVVKAKAHCRSNKVVFYRKLTTNLTILRDDFKAVHRG